MQQFHNYDPTDKYVCHENINVSHNIWSPVNIWGSYQLSVSVSMNEYHLHPYQLIGDNYHPS